MTGRKIAKVGGVVALSAALGAGGAYVGSAASAPSSSSAAAQKAPPNGKRHGRFGALRRAVHADAIVATKDGKFVTVTLDRGIVEKVDGSQLTLKEGTKKATYKTVTLDIPSGAVVRVNRKPGKLSDIKAGQVAAVVKGPKKTRVLAHDPGKGRTGQPG